MKIEVFNQQVCVCGASANLICAEKLRRNVVKMEIKDLRVKKLLEQIKWNCIQIFGGNLVGVYVHGSIAFGCFCWENSDIDLIIVTEKPPRLEQKEALVRILLELDAQGPQKGLEMSVVLERYCKDFVYPTPFELHFSNVYKEGLLAGGKTLEEHDNTENKVTLEEYRETKTESKEKNIFCEYCRHMNGVDKDLAAHFTVLRAVGFALYGKELSSVFGEVPREDYLDSIWADIAGAENEITENPVYVILNLCRVLAFVEDGLVCSKEQGGAWVLEKFPGDFAGRGLVEEARECYRTGKKFKVSEERLKIKDFQSQVCVCAASANLICAEKPRKNGKALTETELRGFAREMLAKIQVWKHE